MQEEKDLAVIANSFDTTTAQTGLFDQDSTVPGLGAVDTLVKQLVFQKPGDYGRFKRNPVQGYLFYQILEIKDPSDKPFEEVKEKVIDLVKNMKATILATEIAQKEAEMMQTGKSIESIAESYPVLSIQETTLTVASEDIEGIGRDPEFKKKVLELNQTKNVGGSQYQGRVYLFALKGRELPKDEEIDFKKAEIRRYLVQQLRQVFVGNDMKRIRETASIEILNPFFKTETPGT